MATYTRGVDTTGKPLLGLIQNYKEDEESEIVTAEDENGEVAAADAFNATKNVSMEFVYDTEATKPSSGSELEIDGDKHIVKTVGDSRENKGFRRVSITAVRYLANGVPANTP